LGKSESQGVIKNTQNFKNIKDWSKQRRRERERERERDLPNPIDVQDRGNGGEDQGTGVKAMAALPWEELMGQLPSSLLLTAPSPCRSATHKTQQKKHTRASLHSRAFASVVLFCLVVERLIRAA
jgi:hypothetical protein